MYESDDYDNTKFSHFLFGNHTFRDNRDFNSFRANNGLQYNCFWDGIDDLVENFVRNNTELGIEVYNNDVVAIKPDGIMIRFNFLEDGDIEEWAHSLYEQVYLIK